MAGLKNLHQEMKIGQDNSSHLCLTKGIKKAILSNHIIKANNTNQGEDSFLEVVSNKHIKDIRIRVIAWVENHLVCISILINSIEWTFRTMTEAHLNNGNQIIIKGLYDQTISEANSDLKVFHIKDISRTTLIGKTDSHLREKTTSKDRAKSNLNLIQDGQEVDHMMWLMLTKTSTMYNGKLMS